MAFDPETRQFTSARGYFLVEGRINMTGYALHHRIPWDLLVDVMQRALQGTVHPRVIGYLLTLAPRQTTDLATAFSAAAHQCTTNRAFRRGQGEAIGEAEAELFSLPCNLFQGLSNRLDDPGSEYLDFTPADVDFNASLPEGPAGDLQRVRERLFGILRDRTIDPGAAQFACQRWRALWIAHGGGLNRATGHRAQWWAPGGMPFQQPPFRHWVNEAGVALNAQACIRLNEIVFRRATRKGQG